MAEFYHWFNVGERERSGRKVSRMRPRFRVQPTKETELVTEVGSKKGPHLGVQIQFEPISFEILEYHASLSCLKNGDVRKERRTN